MEKSKQLENRCFESHMKYICNNKACTKEGFSKTGTVFHEAPDSFWRSCLPSYSAQASSDMRVRRIVNHVPFIPLHNEAGKYISRSSLSASTFLQGLDYSYYNGIYDMIVRMYDQQRPEPN